MRRKTPETALTSQIIDYLHLKGYTVKKIYNGGVPIGVKNKQVIYRKKDPSYRGIPDLIAYNNTNFFFIEVKRENGTVKKDQKEFLDAFNKCKKYSAEVVRRIEDIVLLVT